MPIRSRRTLLRPLVAALAVAAAATPAAAQLGAVNPFSFGVSGGAVVPVGDFGDAFKTGYHVNGLIGLRLPAVPVSFRGEVGYSRNDFKGGIDGHTRIISGVANVLISAAPGPTVVLRPYLIAGVGLYNAKGTFDDNLEAIPNDRASARFTRLPATQRAVLQADDNSSETKFGLNGGVGIDLPFPGISTFAEARFVSIFADGGHVNYIPITVGIRF